MEGMGDGVYRGKTYLRNHHMAIKRPLPMSLARLRNMRPDFRDDGRAERYVRYEMAVHLF